MKKKTIIYLFLWIIGIYTFYSLFFYNGTVNLSGDYVYHPDYKDITGPIYIPSEIISYDYDDKYIIVKQKPNRLDDVFTHGYNYRYGRDKSYYWIVSLDSNILLGPLSETEFNESRVKKNITNELRLE